MEATVQNGGPVARRTIGDDCIMSDRSWMPVASERSLVSIIIPTRNRPVMTCEAIGSCRAQTYRPIEVIVVDDGSTDDTVAAIERIRPECERDHIALHVVQQPQSGACAARNRGLKESRGEFIQFLDSDDLLLPGKIKRQVEHLRDHPELMFNYTVAENVDERGRVVSRYGRPVPGGRRRATVSAYLWHTSGPVLRRGLCIEVGPWDETLTANQEFEYYGRLRAIDPRGAFLDEPGLHRRMHGAPSIGQHALHADPASWALSRERAVEALSRVLKERGRWSRGERYGLARQLMLAAEYYAVAGDVTGVRRSMRRITEIAVGVQKVRYWLFGLVTRLFPFGILRRRQRQRAAKQETRSG